MTEAKAVSRALGVPYRVGGAAANDNANAAAPIEIKVIGIGAGALPKDVRPDELAGIMLAGFAGALDPMLNVGDVVVGGMSAAAADALSAKLGTLCSTSEVVCTPQQKAALRARTGAAAVEMEGAAVAKLAQSTGVPFVQVRVISDAAAEALDPRVLRAIDSLGRVKPGALTEILLFHPLMLPKLWRLGRNARIAGKRLGQAVARWMELSSQP